MPSNSDYVAKHLRDFTEAARLDRFAVESCDGWVDILPESINAACIDTFEMVKHDLRDAATDARSGGE